MTDLFHTAETSCETVPPIDEIYVTGADSNQCGPQMFLFRAHGRVYDDDRVGFSFARYRAVRFTPCGAWVTKWPDWYDSPVLRWVDTRRGGKRFAFLSKEDAMYSLKRRNSVQVDILKHRLACAEQVYAALNGTTKPDRKSFDFSD